MNTDMQIPLEDELGDVLEKAMSCAGLTPEMLSGKTGISVSSICDAIDYRPELGPDECRRLALALNLNEVGLCALATGKYPLPDPKGLPFCVWPLRVPYGIGVVNAYIVGDSGGKGLLFDTGPGGGALETAWPSSVREIDAVFVTHIETEHVGGLQDAVRNFGLTHAYVPDGADVPKGMPMAEAETLVFGSLKVTAYRTPGHCATHNCYHVQSISISSARSLLISGDLIFAGSAGWPFHCKKQLRAHLRRVLAAVPADTVIAPGHGPMTTAGNELRFNPFVS